MSEIKNESIIPSEIIQQKIYLIRGVKVMLDRDLAELYGVETKQLKRAVRRNIARFPEDFMFELSDLELEDLRSHIGTSSWGGSRYLPMAFTEQGVAMLSSVLNSERAVYVNIQIIRIFTSLREAFSSNQEILEKLHLIEKKDIEQDEKIVLIFEYLKHLDRAKEEESAYHNRPRIGYKQGKEKGKGNNEY